MLLALLFLSSVSGESVMFSRTSTMFTVEHVEKINSVKEAECLKDIKEPVIGGITLSGKRVCPHWKSL